MRYDVTSPEFFTTGGMHKARYGLFTDYHFSVFRSFILPFTLLTRKMFKNRLEIRSGIGYSFLSAWQRYNYQWVAIDTQTGRLITGNGVDLSFRGISASLALKTPNNFGGEIKIIHVNHDQLLYNEYQSANLIMIKLFYAFPMKGKKVRVTPDAKP